MTPAGFSLAGLACGIKKNGRPDVGLIVADRDCPVAAVFTRNRVRAAPVTIAGARVRRGTARAVLANSGNANACTGPAGERAALEATAAIARALGIDEASVLPASTGVIGVPLPAGLIVRAAPALVAALDPGGVDAFAQAILTTDRGPKVAARSFGLGGRRRAKVLAIAKGAGMIHPDMATTLVFVLTDAPVGRRFLRRALASAVDGSFNRMTVDGDTSTNDAVFLMASGAAGGTPLRPDAEAAPRFLKALTGALEEVGKLVVSDGEGAEHLVRVEVRGAPSDAAATRVARTIATSSLVKTALHGQDPNWGRILAAAGRAGVELDPARARVRIGDVDVYRRGAPVGEAAEAPASAVMARPEYTIRVDLAAGDGRGHYWTCDLGHAYVRLNADYRS